MAQGVFRVFPPMPVFLAYAVLLPAATIGVFLIDISVFTVGFMVLAYAVLSVLAFAPVRITVERDVIALAYLGFRQQLSRAEAVGIGVWEQPVPGYGYRTLADGTAVYAFGGPYMLLRASTGKRIIVSTRPGLTETLLSWL